MELEKRGERTHPHANFVTSCLDCSQRCPCTPACHRACSCGAPRAWRARLRRRRRDRLRGGEGWEWGWRWGGWGWGDRPDG